MCAAAVRRAAGGRRARAEGQAGVRHLHVPPRGVAAAGAHVPAAKACRRPSFAAIVNMLQVQGLSLCPPNNQAKPHPPELTQPYPDQPDDQS